ncbi:redoxin domain-containing protein [Streptomyces sp. MUM 203J]|uniref:peroxiredoxin family protein n=1 Tax=Streptomyces sp. MUM 203J TaxID=2791990 RepID=UPI001F042542|nr:redoxin domain-containing protein [Streptomyces sp. MUM 203J]MCH0542644.1 redoxin domain-containing protein [Streptomyces sp. MUM 203J]
MRRRQRSTRVLAAAVSAVAALALTGCGSGGSGQAGSDAPGASSVAPEALATAPSTPGGTSGASVPDALRFTATTLDGEAFDAATLAGRPTVLWFWAPWCPTCKGQARETARVAAAYEGRANVVGVAGLDKQAAMKTFVSDNELDGFPQLSDEAGEVWKRFRVTQQSSYVVLDRDGEAVHSGVLPGGKGLADKLDALVG